MNWFYLEISNFLFLVLLVPSLYYFSCVKILSVFSHLISLIENKFEFIIQFALICNELLFTLKGQI
uniref:Uncharacterized protein n=1 Tax=Anguilla anguilla TaxID=7936 RepID=A0A0E9TH70_ANGAN